MPIYEYECETCGLLTSALILNPREEETLRCEHCQGKSLTRVLSRFALHKTESQRLKEFNPRAPRDDSFYKDSRNVGLWAKKRSKELGVDLGDQFEEVVEKARTSNHPEDFEP
ncbi:MAG: zinc ribbon domain-containing protein [Deltaproteobacteria bacterium]|nr:zinc ribbon domain-containing protein [Deltaproteobacteria bacterium]MBW2052941.1 zinc ribbon domain-containing protein [Deltaproteobacteria bacterium]MBW2141643.1 zinc ribbon domain-containing protein [Deltaproteobacteria bacterium]MBW2324330.1 zinc ribbon domain-containing protein [Deltaproteobacteria bacterium]